MSTTWKCVLVGDGFVGKTSILTSFHSDNTCNEYIPTVCENFTKEFTVDDETVCFHLWDTAGQEGYERLRSISYPQTDIFIVVFSVAEPVSLANVTEVWLPEIRHHCPQTPFLLVGNKMDLRDRQTSSEGTKVITSKEGRSEAKKLGAMEYRECSALKGGGIMDVFIEAAKCVKRQTVKEASKSRKKVCVIV